MFYWRANICSPICIKMNNLIYTASTWIWAPALFVSSSVAYYYGLAGLAIFLIPNILCLILFGFNRFDERRLFWGTIGGLVIGSCGYVILSLLGLGTDTNNLH